MSSNTGILTKEEILGKHTGEHGIYLTKGQICGSDALDAMDEYAQQQERVTAIAFAEWLSNYEKGIVPRNENGKVVWYFNDGESVYNGSTESVYELYLKQTNQ